MKKLDKKWKRGIWIALALILVILIIIYRVEIRDVLSVFYAMIAG